MHKNLLAATALCTTIAFFVPASAYAQARDWTGIYAGGLIGGVISDSDLTFDVLDTASIDASGGLVGATAGYNWDVGRVVAGIEADASFLDVRGSSTDFDDEYEAQIKSLFTLRARMGFKAGDALIYGTAGLAGAHVSFRSDVGGGDVARGSGFELGPVGGIGLEYALTDRLSLKTEGLLFAVSGVEGVGDSGKGGDYSGQYKPSGAVIRAGVNFKF